MSDTVQQFATLKSLKTLIRANRKAYDSNYFKLNNGWKSTSAENPALGMIFKNTPLRSVSFTDKYGKFHKCILTQITLEDNKVFATVLSNRCNPFSTEENLAERCINCRVELSTIGATDLLTNLEMPTL